LLILKLCINSLTSLVNQKELKPEEKALKELNRLKIKLRYFLYYPILIGVFAALSTGISISRFHSEKTLFLLISALLSFFFGLFIDSIPNLFGKFADMVLPNK
jgi:uncharacterized membrane protein